MIHGGSQRSCPAASVKVSLIFPQPGSWGLCRRESGSPGLIPMHRHSIWPPYQYQRDGPGGTGGRHSYAQAPHLLASGRPRASGGFFNLMDRHRVCSLPGPRGANVRHKRHPGRPRDATNGTWGPLEEPDLAPMRRRSDCGWPIGAHFSLNGFGRVGRVETTAHAYFRGKDQMAPGEP